MVAVVEATVAVVSEDVVAVAATLRVVSEDPIALVGSAVEPAIFGVLHPLVFLVMRQAWVGFHSYLRCRWWFGLGF